MGNCICEFIISLDKGLFHRGLKNETLSGTGGGNASPQPPRSGLSVFDKKLTDVKSYTLFIPLL
jgi:hypothetical protein